MYRSVQNLRDSTKLLDKELDLTKKIDNYQHTFTAYTVFQLQS